MLATPLLREDALQEVYAVMAQHEEQQLRPISLDAFLQLSDVEQNLVLDAATVLDRHPVVGALAVWGQLWGVDAASTLRDLQQQGWVGVGSSNWGLVLQAQLGMRALARRIITGGIPELQHFVGSRIWYDAGQLVQPQEVCAWA